MHIFHNFSAAPESQSQLQGPRSHALEELEENDITPIHTKSDEACTPPCQLPVSSHLAPSGPLPIIEEFVSAQAPSPRPQIPPSLAPTVPSQTPVCCPAKDDRRYVSPSSNCPRIINIAADASSTGDALQTPGPQTPTKDDASSIRYNPSPTPVCASQYMYNTARVVAPQEFSFPPTPPSLRPTPIANKARYEQLDRKASSSLFCLLILPFLMQYAEHLQHQSVASLHFSDMLNYKHAAH